MFAIGHNQTEFRFLSTGVQKRGSWDAYLLWVIRSGSDEYEYIYRIGTSSPTRKDDMFTLD